MFGFWLKEPALGDDITADWARELVRAVRSLRLQPGPGIKLSRTPDGSTISVAKSAYGGAGRRDPNVAHKGEDPSDYAVPKYLGGDDEDANDEEWELGDTDPETGKPTYPVYNPTRLYWDAYAHKLYQFRRTETFNTSGVLVAVSAEVRSVVFTTVPENF